MGRSMWFWDLFSLVVVVLLVLAANKLFKK
jgi:Sec-independent protein translocase protein TatA